jgi:hypothetical protein
MKGFTANPGGRPLSAVTELRAQYSRRVPEIFGALMKMAMDNSQPPLVQLAAIRLALDHLIGRPAISIDTVTTEADVAARVRSLYIAAMRKAGEANEVGKTIDGGNSINGGVGAAAGDPKEIQ